MADLKPHLAQVLRYGIVGLSNTALGLALIYALDLGLNVPPKLANGIGYGAGAVVSFVLYKTFVFGSAARLRTVGPRYVAVILVSFMLNQVVLWAGLSILGNGIWEHALAQFSGMATYTVFSFLALRFWVFAPKRF